VSAFAPPVQRLITELSKLPGIGGRTAQRLAFHVLRASDEEAASLAEAILEVKSRIGLCEVCFNLADGPRCRICQDERRDPEVICVVEEPSDVISIERTHEFHGRYHVLGGALSPIDGVDPEDLKIAELYVRVDAGEDASRFADVAGGSSWPVREVVIATNPTTTGEATALHIAGELRARHPELTVTRLASGLPVGSDLEYADELTLGRAFAGRRAV
jgi:recombination protein RecR